MHNRTTASGRFIAIEGGEGAGKSRLLNALAERLSAAEREVVLTREPGGTPLGEAIRALVLSHQRRTDPTAELLLFEAARAQLVSTLIRPALERDAVVICDRFGASSIAYQSFGRGIPRDVVERANAIATGGLVPALTLLLDLPVAAGLARRADAGGGNRFDAESIEFHKRVRDGFLTLAQEEPGRWCVIDASQPFESVLATALEAVLPLVP